MSDDTGLLALLTGQLGQLPLLLVWLLALPLGGVLMLRSRGAGLLLLASALLFWLGWVLRMGLQLYMMQAFWWAGNSPVVMVMGGVHLAVGLASAGALLGAVWVGRQSEVDEDELFSG